MKNKKLMIVVISLLIVIIAFTSFVLVGKANIKNKMDEYLKNKGYSTNEIAKVKVSHNAINYILGYDVWGISVEYVDEPDVLYFYSYKNKEIVTAGVGGKGAEKENLKHDEDYKNENTNGYISNHKAITSIDVYKYSGTEYKNNLVEKVTDKKDIEKIVKILSNAKRVSADTDLELSQTDYALEIMGENSNWLHIIDIWLDKDKTIISYKEISSYNYFTITNKDDINMLIQLCNAQTGDNF